ncbi:MAG: BON domain-containing protein [Planctomycetaceae bacterium]|nr:BON domain-containing protein [Planctomycetaceae bacterium]
MCNECAGEHPSEMRCPRIAQRDLQIGELALARLMATGRFRDGDVRCDVRNGEVVLRGRVATWYHKQVAQHAVLETANVVSVQNQIEVGPPSTSMRSASQAGDAAKLIRAHDLTGE